MRQYPVIYNQRDNLWASHPLGTAEGANLGLYEALRSFLSGVVKGKANDVRLIPAFEGTIRPLIRLVFLQSLRLPTVLATECLTCLAIVARLCVRSEANATLPTQTCRSNILSHVVESVSLGRGQQQEIVKRVILLVPINMVNLLLSLQRPSDMLRHHKAVLKDIFSLMLDYDIPAAMQPPSALPTMVIQSTRMPNVLLHLRMIFHVTTQLAGARAIHGFSNTVRPYLKGLLTDLTLYSSALGRELTLISSRVRCAAFRTNKLGYRFHRLLHCNTGYVNYQVAL